MCVLRRGRTSTILSIHLQGRLVCDLDLYCSTMDSTNFIFVNFFLLGRGARARALISTSHTDTIQYKWMNGTCFEIIILSWKSNAYYCFLPYIEFLMFLRDRHWLCRSIYIYHTNFTTGQHIYKSLVSVYSLQNHISAKWTVRPPY